jgi:peroxiredoxin
VKRYVEDHELPCDLLIDDGREVLTAFGAWQQAPGAVDHITRPAVFLIGQDAVIRYAFVAEWQYEFPFFDDLLVVLKEARNKK